MLKTFRLVSVVGIILVGGCGHNSFTARQNDVDAAYKRGEITLVQREEMTHQINQDRSQHQAAVLGMMQQMGPQMAPPPTSAQPVLLTRPGYDIYNQNNQKVGTLQPR